MSFLYSILLKLLYPTSVSILLLLTTIVLWRYNRERAAKVALLLAVGVLLICGNGWVVQALTRHLERLYPPLAEVQSPQSMGYSPAPDVSSPPLADAIVVLSGGIYDNAPPRPTVEIGEAGDRLLYGACLLRQHRAPRIICTGNVSTGSIGRRPLATQMAEFLGMIGVPTNAVLTELRSENTHEHAKNLFPMFQEAKIKRVLLVTSAMHMPRSMGAFRKQCPNIEFIPAPTDYRSPDTVPAPWYRQMTRLIPTPSTLASFSEVMHEYLGMLWYKLSGWI